MKKVTILMASAIVALGADAASEKVWEGSFDYGNWNDPVTIESAAFANAKAGDVISLVYSSVEAGAQYQLAFNDDANYCMAVEYAEIPGKIATYTLTGKEVGGSTATDVEMLKTSGFMTKGHDAVLAEVYFGEEYQGEKPTGMQTVWEGESPLGSWSNDVEIGSDGTVFADLYDGDTLVFNFTDCGDTPMIQINTKLGAGWVWTTIVDADPIVGGKYEYKVSNAMAATQNGGADAVTVDLATIKTRGIIVKGQEATLKSIQISHGQGGSAVAGIQTDENAPVEIFTLDGRRVASMENGIYVVRRGNKTMKVVK